MDTWDVLKKNPFHPFQPVSPHHSGSVEGQPKCVGGVLVPSHSRPWWFKRLYAKKKQQKTPKEFNTWKSNLKTYSKNSDQYNHMSHYYAKTFVSPCHSFCSPIIALWTQEVHFAVKIIPATGMFERNTGWDIIYHTSKRPVIRWDHHDTVKLSTGNLCIYGILK